MATGVFNPFDDARTTAVAPAHVPHAAGVRKFFDDGLDPIPHSQEFNLLWQNLYSAGDYYGAADNEGDVNYIRSILQTIVDNAEWTQSGATGTMDISAKRGLKGTLASVPATGIVSFGAVQANKVALIFYNASTPRAIVPGATILTPNNAPVVFTQGDSFLLVGAADGSAYRLTPLPRVLLKPQQYPIATNGDFEQWPDGFSITPAANTTTFLAYGWKGRRASTGWTVTKQTGFFGARNCMRVWRTAGDTSTNPIYIGYQIPSHIMQALQGKNGIISFDLRCGATMVTALGAGATLATEYREGGGYDETPSMTNGVFTTAIGGASAGTFLGGYTPSTTEIRVFCNPWLSNAAATEAIFRIIFTPIATAAGASEYFEIDNLRVDVGALSYQFMGEPQAIAELRMASGVQKSFTRNTAPIQSIGAGTGIRVPCTTAGAAAQFVAHVEFKQEMRTAPTVVLYNPAAANAQVRNITRATDSTGAAVANITAKGFDITCTGAAGWVVGDTLEFHYYADARL